MERFYWRWKQSGQVLTLTGSYLGDEEQYPEFWADVRLYGLLYNVQEELIEKTIKTTMKDNG